MFCKTLGWEQVETLKKREYDLLDFEDDRFESDLKVKPTALGRLFYDEYD